MLNKEFSELGPFLSIAPPLGPSAASRGKLPGLDFEGADAAKAPGALSFAPIYFLPGEIAGYFIIFLPFGAPGPVGAFVESIFVILNEIMFYIQIFEIINLIAMTFNSKSNISKFQIFNIIKISKFKINKKKNFKN